MKTVHLGFEVGSGAPVAIPLKHLAVCGQTQEAGKTTTLEALIARSQLRAVTFVTKRGEGSFTNARRIAPYFREQTDWQFVASILEASRGEKLKFERAWIIRASKGARTLADVQHNVRNSLQTAKGLSADVYLTLDAYLDQVVPQIAIVKWAPSLELKPGVNAMDLSGVTIEMQHLVIRSAITWVLEREQGTVVVVPEAWKFIPQGRGTPVKLAAEAFIRQGAALGNYLWLDSQDLGGIEKAILRSVAVWLLGVQREANEIKRTLDNIPASTHKPRAADIARLELGQFFACWGPHTVRTYVQPVWLDEKAAYTVAVRGQAQQEAVSRSQARQVIQTREEASEVCERHEAAEREMERVRKSAEQELAKALKRGDIYLEESKTLRDRAAVADELGRALARVLPPGAGGGAAVDEEAIVARVLARIPTNGHGPITVTPPEKLRKDFQRDESERMVALARGLKPLQKRVLKLLETTGGEYVGQPTLNQRLGRSASGGSMSDMGSAVQEMATSGLVDVKARAGVAKRLRQKIAEDLAFYNAADAEVEAVYQNVLHELATEG